MSDELHRVSRSGNPEDFSIWEIAPDGAIDEKSLGYLQFVERRGLTVCASFTDSSEGREWVPRIVFSDRDSGTIHFIDEGGNDQYQHFHVVRSSDSPPSFVAELAAEIGQRLKDDPWFAAMFEVKMRTVIAELETQASDIEEVVMPGVSEGTQSLTLQFRRK